MVIIDEYSRYPVVETLTSLTAKSVIPLLDKTFSIFGIPKELKSDNGPLWARANAESERFMKTIGKAHTEHRSWKQDIHIFLRNYRATPHATTDMSPAEILFGRKINTKLPDLTFKSPTHNMIRKKDKDRKLKMKTHFENKHCVKPSQFKVGDSVLVKQEKKNKLTTPFNPTPLKVKEKKGSMITATDGQNKMITSNSSHFKKVGESIMNKEEIEEILDGNNSDTPDTTLRRSSRGRKPPKYLDDYVCSKINK
jgi:hypothetical protein